MKKFLAGLNKALEILFRILEIYSKIVIFGVVILICAQVIARRVFHNSILWSEEMVLLLMVWVAFIATAMGVAKNIHIRITVFYNWMPKPLQKALQWLEYLITLFVGVMMMIYGWKLSMATAHSTLPTTKLPSLFLYIMIPVSGFYVVYCTILHMFFPKAAEIFLDKEDTETENELPAGTEETAAAEEV